jgi:uncharacterized protein with GYD domain
MQVYFMIGKYSAEGVRDLSVDRTEKCVHLIKQVGGEILSMFALLGAYDVVLKVKLPNNQAAMQASVALSLLTGITFTTMPAVPVDDFDRIMSRPG